MKITISFLVLSFIISGNFAQAPADTWDHDIYIVGKTYPGYIIKSNGEKVEGYLEAQQRGEIAGVGNSNQTRVVFFSDPDDKKTKVIYKPEDLQAYMIADKYYKAMHYSGGLTKGPVRFLLRVKDGAIAQYAWYNNTGTDGVIYFWEEKMIFQKGDGDPRSTDDFALKFADKMSEWVADNKELAAKVQNKEKGYGVLNILEIIDEYNAWYKESHP